MKKLVCLVFVALVVALSLCTAFAHGGRTDDNGGHYDRDSGEYHYHHGYSAHQHFNGKCPYEDETTTCKSEDCSSSVIKENSDSTFMDFIGNFLMFLLCFSIWFCIWILPGIISDIKKKKGK
jgi:hypothetical protein